jgi:hypothetical protein
VGSHVPRLVHTELFVAAGDSIPHHDVRAEVRAIQELYLPRTKLGSSQSATTGPAQWSICYRSQVNNDR